MAEMTPHTVGTEHVPKSLSASGMASPKGTQRNGLIDHWLNYEQRGIKQLPRKKDTTDLFQTETVAFSSEVETQHLREVVIPGPLLPLHLPTMPGTVPPSVQCQPFH